MSCVFLKVRRANRKAESVQGAGGKKSKVFGGVRIASPICADLIYGQSQGWRLRAASYLGGADAF